MVKAIESRGARDRETCPETTGQIFDMPSFMATLVATRAADIKPRDVLRATIKTNYVRGEAKQLLHLLRMMEVYPEKHVTRLAIKLMALTFVRTGELIGARWSEFHLESARWDIPAERMKMRTPHVVPLAGQALEVLAQLHGLTGEPEWLFPGDITRAKHMSTNTIHKGLERMGHKSRMTGHGFRGIESTILHGQGFPHGLEVDLGFKRLQVTSCMAAGHGGTLEWRRFPNVPRASHDGDLYWCSFPLVETTRILKVPGFALGRPVAPTFGISKSAVGR